MVLMHNNKTHLLIEIAECVGDCCAGPEER